MPHCPSLWPGTIFLGRRYYGDVMGANAKRKRVEWSYVARPDRSTRLPVWGMEMASRRRKNSTRSKVFYAAASLGLFLAVWQLASLTGLFGRYPVRLMSLFLPSPVQVAGTFGELISSGELWRHVGVSIYRVAVGFLIAAAIGIPLGAAMARYRRVYDFFEPVLRLFQPIPGVAWVPLAIIWFGLGDRAAIFIIVVGSVFPILLNTIQGLRDVDSVLVKAALTAGAQHWHVLTKVIVPSVIPYLVTGFRLGVGFAWRVVLAAEMVGVPSGLGYMLTLGRGVGRTDITLVTMVTLGVIMFLTEQLFFIPLEGRTLRWKKGLGGV